MQEGVGHYGIFNGSLYKFDIAPRLKALTRHRAAAARGTRRQEYGTPFQPDNSVTPAQVGTAHAANVAQTVATGLGMSDIAGRIHASQCLPRWRLYAKANADPIVGAGRSSWMVRMPGWAGRRSCRRTAAETDDGEAPGGVAGARGGRVGRRSARSFFDESRWTTSPASPRSSWPKFVRFVAQCDPDTLQQVLSML
jgi:hypothetical protein